MILSVCYSLLESSCVSNRHSKTFALFVNSGGDKGLKVRDFEFSVFFFFNALVSADCILLQSSE